METKVGRFINKLMKEYDELRLSKDPVAALEIHPRYRGKVLCIGYISCLFGENPMFTIGPDWRMSFLELLLVNLCMFAISKGHLADSIS